MNQCWSCHEYDELNPRGLCPCCEADEREADERHGRTVARINQNWAEEMIQALDGES